MAIGPDRKYMTRTQADAAQIDVGRRRSRCCEQFVDDPRQPPRIQLDILDHADQSERFEASGEAPPVAAPSSGSLFDRAVERLRR